MSRPTVLVAIKGLGIGGAEKLIVEGAKHWDVDRFDYRVAYMLPWKNQLVPDLEVLDVPVTCLGGKRGMTPPAAWRLRRHSGQIGADMVHAHSPTVGIAARLLTAPPLVYTEHNLAGSYREPTRTLNRLTYGRNRAVTAVSAPVADSLNGYPGPEPIVIPNGVAVSVAADEAAAARHELGIGQSDPLVVHVGNIRPGKGHDTLVESVARMPIDVTVVSIGAEKYEGDLDRIRQSATSAGVDDRLSFLGRRPDALSFIAAADVYVNPADHEGLPVTILEALAVERPVVATAVGGVPSVVNDGQTGLLVAPNDPEALATAILTLLEDPARAKLMAAQGRQLVEDRYGLESMIRSFEDLYEEVLGG